MATRENDRDIEWNDRNKVNDIHSVLEEPGQMSLVPFYRLPKTAHFHFFGQMSSLATYSREKKAIARL